MWDKHSDLARNKSFGGKDQRQESCNSAFFVKKKPNKTITQNIEQPKHLTDLLTTDIKESRNTRKDTLQETSHFTRQFD